MSDMKRLLSGAYILGYSDARNDKAIDVISAIEQLTMNLNKNDLIRCKDCNHYIAIEDRHYCGIVDIWDTEPNWFCGDAEKKAEMTNGDKFKSIFGIYATELWAKPENDFLNWLNAESPTD